LVQIHLRFGNIDLILQVIFLRFWRGRQFAGQGCDRLLILFQRLRGLFLALRNLFGFR
jgi:hypothetical protein